ncbi:hypothetical protein AFK20_01640 [Enhydrobacter aerosaccus]|uniref:YD repeat-containing protein n=1 Tax=Enhydrobacter aerosaccus TaxID=225324 RepID=A0ABR5IPB0_9HYPH|nr:hypothetical protein [Enhydrobacter aerosaccus]KND22826.1 hypothetical protein AFK20_01640 [Enhydrobacter aerosaccus]
MQANMGMAGEFRVVVKRVDGSTKIDTGYQKNLILNQGLDFFGGNNGSDMMAYCVIGSGNSQPVYTQNKLDTAIAGVSGADFSTKNNYNASTDGNLYKTNRVRKYSFSGLNNTNISELGLASTYSATTTYFLCTRALIKDSQGNPTTITVLSGEVLEIYYKVWAVYDITDKTGQINLLDGAGGSVAYNYQFKLANVGNSSYYLSQFNNVSPASSVGKYQSVCSGDLSAITASPTNKLAEISNSTMQSYVASSYKRIALLPFAVNEANGSIRTVVLDAKIGCWQIRFGSVANDSPITKTNTQTLTIPIEISWGRYEGAL